MVKKNARLIFDLLRATSRPGPAGAQLLWRSSDERGSSAVEFALSAAVLFMLMFGVMLMCLALYSYHFVAEAAREGTRYEMVRGSA